MSRTRIPIILWRIFLSFAECERSLLGNISAMRQAKSDVVKGARRVADNDADGLGKVEKVTAVQEYRSCVLKSP